MIKLFEPFQPKIQLHIRQDFLQELWDKYVPVSSESYEKISLIYLKETAGEIEKSAKPVRILVDLVLKNLMMQIHISQNPMLITQKGVSSSLRCTLQYYLAQLKRTDRQAFQSINRYMTSLRQAEEENTRYESWKKDSRILWQMEKEYQILRHFSQSLREWSSVRSLELEKALETELLRSMKKSEYRIFAKSMVWQERQQIAEYIRDCSQTVYQQLTERLVKEPSFHFLIRSEDEISKEVLIEQIESHFEQDMFWKFYHKVLFLEKSGDIAGEEIFSEEDVSGAKDMQIDFLIWEKNRKRMLRRLEQWNSEEIHVLWEQICDQIADTYEQQAAELRKDQTEQRNAEQEPPDAYTTLGIKIEEIQKKYVLEMKNRFQTIVEETQEQEHSEIISRVMEHQPALIYNKDLVSRETTDTERTVQIKETIDQERAEESNETTDQDSAEESNETTDQESRAESSDLSEVQVLRNAVGKIRQEVEYRLEEQKDRIVEREIKVLNRYRDILHVKEIFPVLPLSDQAVQKLWSWSRVLLSDTEYDSRSMIPQELREDSETALENLIEQLNTSEKQQTFYMEYRKSSIENEEIQELLRYTRQMNQEQYSMFISVLADMIQLRQESVQKQMEAYGQEVEKVFQSYYGTGLTEEAFRKLQSWSEALQGDSGPVRTHNESLREGRSLSVQSRTVNEFSKEQESVIQNPDEEVTTEERTEFQKIVEQINEYGAKGAFHLEYRESILANQTVQELLGHIRRMDQEQYPLLARALSVMIRIRQQTEQELQYHDVEKIFRTQYGTGLSGEAVRKLHHWSEALLRTDREEAVLPVPDEETGTTYQTKYAGKNAASDSMPIDTEGRAEFQKIIEQINTYGRQQAFHIEYREHILANETVRELLRYIRQMDQEQYPLLVRALSDMIQARQTVRERIEKTLMLSSQQESAPEFEAFDPEKEREDITALEPEELRYRDVEKVFRSYYGTTELTAEAVRELHHWSEVLQARPGQGHQDQEELIPEIVQESTDHISEDMQTQIIRQHIQQAKDRSELHQLVEQVNHYAGGEVRLEYREEQIRNPSIQALIRHIRQLDEEQYRSFVRQLSGMIEVRQSIHDQTESAGTGSTNDRMLPGTAERENAVREHAASPEAALLHRTQKQLYKRENGWKDRGKALTIRDDQLTDQKENLPDQTTRFSRQAARSIYEIYPKLSHRIQEYEVRRRESYETTIRQLIPYRMKSGSLEGMRDGIHPDIPDGTKSVRPERQEYESRQDLKYAAAKNQMQNRQPEREELLQEERIRMKSAQAQMDVRLKQVEQQLKQVEVQTGRKEDVRETAEKIKKLLHEELHLEKLRRGMT